MSTRRSFLKRATLGGAMLNVADFSCLSQLGAAEGPPVESVRFTSEIEPLVRLIEETPRERLVEEVAHRLKHGLSYNEILTALLLAGVRNVEPRPSVGFKFHAVLVVNSAHLASLSSTDEDRWLPIFWALDYFKSSQARDVREGNWTMSAVDESRVPGVDRADSAFRTAMESWDVEAADVAVSGLARTTGANQVFESFARYGIRDFRSIGHKAIFVANSWRTLNCIGWRYAEPVLRSLAYALLNHGKESNPADSDHDADRPWRRNQQLAQQIRMDWLSGRSDDQATLSLLSALRTNSPDEVCDYVVRLLNDEVSPQSIYDAYFLAAGELLMRQPGIVALHASTTTNAMHQVFQQSSDDQTRRLVVLQNAAFLPMFRDAMSGRGDVGSARIDELQSVEVADESPLDGIFRDVSGDRQVAASKMLRYLENNHSPVAAIQAARRLIFLKGTDSHDYKFSSAVLEDFYAVSPKWRNHFLAASVYKLRGTHDKDNGLIERIRNALV